MKQITWRPDNANGVSIYKSEYVGKGIYDCQIAAENMEVGDIFFRHKFVLAITEIKGQQVHKSDKSLIVYDCMLKDESWQTETGYIFRLPICRLP